MSPLRVFPKALRRTSPEHELTYQVEAFLAAKHRASQLPGHAVARAFPVCPIPLLARTILRVGSLTHAPSQESARLEIQMRGVPGYRLSSTLDYAAAYMQRTALASNRR